VTESLPPEDPRDALIREQAALIAGLSAQVTDLSAQLAELTGLVRELRGQLEAARRAASRNSGNSSMPPSSDDLPDRKAPAPRAQAGQAAGRPGRTSCLVADTGRDGGAVPGGLVPVRPGPHGRG
jgi:hypothetical protein